MMDTKIAKFLSEKIRLNPDFAKMLSKEELDAVNGLVNQTNGRNNQHKAKYETFVEKREKYIFYPIDFFVRMYWYDNGFKPQSCIINNYTKEFCITRISKDEFKSRISKWLDDEKNLVEDPFAKCEWMSEREMVDHETESIVGDLVKSLLPKDRYFIVWYPPYTYKDAFGTIEKHEASLGTVDILRGIGVYGIMSDSPYSLNGYFNNHYFESISDDTDQDIIFKKSKNLFDCTKCKNERFSILRCKFDAAGKIDIVEKSDVMTYEEHFERLFGFNPIKKNQ